MYFFTAFLKELLGSFFFVPYQISQSVFLFLHRFIPCFDFVESYLHSVNKKQRDEVVKSYISLLSFDIRSATVEVSSKRQNPISVIESRLSEQRI